MHKLCYCTDRCDVPMLARPTNNGNWELFTISEVLGFGNCKYDTKVLEEEFQEITPINSYRGTSYVALRKNDLWALIQISDDRTLECTWKYIADFKYTNLDDLLERMSINKNDFNMW